MTTIEKIAIGLALWTLVSIPVGILVGMCIKFGMGDEQ